MSPPKSETKELMFFFVREIAGRNVTPADFRGRHMRTAKLLLKDYNINDICGALISLRDRECAHFGYDKDELPYRGGKIEGMEVLYTWGEPPLIERWLTPPDRPPIYSYDYDVWVQRWGKRAVQRGVWDGIYLKQDPRIVQEWLEPAIGPARFKESVKRWQTRQKTSRQSEPSSSTSARTPPL